MRRPADVYFPWNDFVVISLGQLEMPNSLHLLGKVVATPSRVLPTMDISNFKSAVTAVLLFKFEVFTPTCTLHR